MLAESGHLLREPAAFRRGNERLAAGRARAGGAAARIDHAHFATGPFPSGHAVRRHTHEQAQIEAVVRGRFRFETARAHCLLAPGDACVIPPEWAHAWRCEASGVLLGVLFAAPGAAAVRDPDTGDGLRALRGADHARRLAEVVAAATTPEAPRGLDRTGFALGLWLTGLLEAALPAPPGEAEEASAGDRSWGAAACDRAAAFMRANLAKPIRLADVASEAGLSPRHLTRLFRARFGRPPMAELLEMRLREAQRLLRQDPRRTARSVARACGFRQAPYFTRCYRARFGCAPSADRGREGREEA